MTMVLRHMVISESAAARGHEPPEAKAWERPIVSAMSGPVSHRSRRVTPASSTSVGVHCHRAPTEAFTAVGAPSPAGRQLPHR